MSKRFPFAALSLVAAIFVLLAAPQPAAANAPTLIGNYSDWSAYSFTEDGNKVCYMASQPTKAEGNYTRRGDIFALITHRPAESTRNVFSYITGYAYQSGSDVTVNIDGRRFSLFTQDETAWAPDAAMDNSLAQAIRSGRQMVVTGTSARGTKTTDTFSLRGSAAAHDAITKECGM